MRTKEPLYCSFCGKSQLEVRKLIAGPTVFICDECTDLCSDILHRGQVFLPDQELPEHSTVLALLNGYLPTQIAANAHLAGVLCRHHHRNASESNATGNPNSPQVVLLWGSSLDRVAVAQALWRSVWGFRQAVDAAKLIRHGKSTGLVSHLLEDFLNISGLDPSDLGRSILFIDDLDQLRMRGGAKWEDRDAACLAVQKALSELFSGKVVSGPFPGARDTVAKYSNTDIDSSKMTFICGGGFGGRLNPAPEKPAPVGSQLQSLSKIERTVLLDEGFLPELVESFSGVIPLE